jgi:hypothetical protein
MCLQWLFLWLMLSLLFVYVRKEELSVVVLVLLLDCEKCEMEKSESEENSDPLLPLRKFQCVTSHNCSVSIMEMSKIELSKRV